MSRSRSRRAQSRQRSDQPTTVDALRDLLESNLHIIALNVCRACSGTGRCPDKNPDGSLTFSRCACKNRAEAFLQEWNFLDPEGKPPKEDDEDDDEDEDD